MYYLDFNFVAISVDFVYTPGRYLKAVKHICVKKDYRVKICKSDLKTSENGRIKDWKCIMRNSIFDLNISEYKIETCPFN